MSGYPLDAVETARRADVTESERALADRMRERDAREADVARRREALDAHDRTTEAARERAREIASTTHAASEMVRQRAWAERRAHERVALVGQLDGATVALRDAERAVSGARESLVAAKAALETVLRHREGWEHDRRRALERRADAALDEVAARRARKS